MTPETLDKLQNLLRDSGLLEQIIRGQWIENICWSVLGSLLFIVGTVMVVLSRRARTRTGNDDYGFGMIIGGVISVFSLFGVMALIITMVKLHATPLAVVVGVLLSKH